MKSMMRIWRWLNRRLQKTGKSDKTKMPHIGSTFFSREYSKASEKIFHVFQAHTVLSNPLRRKIELECGYILALRPASLQCKHEIIDERPRNQ
jgi:hypothetical protein